MGDLPAVMSDDEAHELMAREWRVGSSWQVTIVARGTGPLDEHDRQAGDTLIGFALNPALAKSIVEAHNIARDLRYLRQA